MKKSIILLCFFLSGMSLFSQDYLNVMTFNIRYNTPADSLNSWPLRKDFAASQIMFHEVGLLGVQEALLGQINDLKERLPGFESVGVARDDGKEKGEFSAIIYNTKRLQLIKSGNFWLSETPDIPGSKGWDAAYPRMVTWARFRDLNTKKEFFFFNTHFDHMGKIARKESAKLLMAKVNEMVGTMPTIITGDFNAKPEDEPIKLLANAQDPLAFTDAKKISQTPHYGPTGTFTGFQSKEVDEFPIDYIFLRNKVKVLKHATLSQTWQGRFSSDHFPVYARLII